MFTVMVTRPKPQGEELCEKIQAELGRAIYFPTIEISPPKNLEKLKKAIVKLDQYDIIIFVSAHAVYQSADYIHQCWPNLPSNFKMVAIGKATAEALKKVNLPLHFYPATDWSSEGLLSAPILQEITGQKIALIRGETGREKLAEVLTRRGAEVDNVVAYRRVMPKINVEPFKKLIAAREIDIIICTSNEILQNLIDLLDVQQVPLMVISERMLSFAKKLGFNHLFLAENASHDAIMSELVKLKDQLCQMKKTIT